MGLGGGSLIGRFGDRRSDAAAARETLRRRIRSRLCEYVGVFLEPVPCVRVLLGRARRQCPGTRATSARACMGTTGADRPRHWSHASVWPHVSLVSIDLVLRGGRLCRERRHDARSARWPARLEAGSPQHWFSDGSVVRFGVAVRRGQHRRSNADVAPANRGSWTVDLDPAGGRAGAVSRVVPVGLAVRCGRQLRDSCRHEASDRRCERLDGDRCPHLCASRLWKVRPRYRLQREPDRCVVHVRIAVRRG